MTDFSQQSFGLELLLARTGKKKPQVVAEGSDNERAVRALQEHLTKLGYDIQVDGQFGPDTKKAVSDFQGDHGATVDGVVGKQTFGKLTRATGRPGDKNPANVSIDDIGKAVGVKGVGGGATAKPAIRPTGVFGAGRQSQGPALKPGQQRDASGNLYRTQTGQTASKDHPIGNTDPAKAPGNQATQAAGQKDAPQDNNSEFNKLHPREGGKFAPKQGDSGDQSVAVQQHLKAAGYDPGKIDGQFGPKTDKQVRKFQKDHQLKSDGIVGLQTTAALRASVRARRQLSK